MGIALPQLAPASEDRVSGAQVIDGSLKFNKTSGSYLTRTPGSAGNRKTFTLSGWFKLSSITTGREFFVAGTSNSDRTRLLFNSGDKLNFYNRVSSTTHDDDKTTALFRDTSSFYHVVFSIDNANTTGTVYINGQISETFTTVDTDTYINNNTAHYIGGQVFNDNNYYDGHISQLYLIDGQALGPESFGYTDPLTNTWRPKKFSGTFPSGTAASSIFSSNTLLTWAGGTAESNWALSNSNKTATYSGSSSYSDVYTAALNSSTTYAFRLTSTGVDSNGGWFFTDDTSVSGSHPDERGGDTLGQRANETTLGAHGSFATANSVSAGQGAMSGFGDSQPSDGSQIDFIINMSARKVWVKAASSGSYVGGGDPTDASSTASFLLPTGTIYFGNVQYSGSDIITFGDDSIGNNSFYLPMDGNSPIGEDKSGKGNNWTPVNFGGSVALDNPTSIWCKTNSEY